MTGELPGMARVSQLYERARLTDWAWEGGGFSSLQVGLTPQMCNCAGQEEETCVELCRTAESESAGPKVSEYQSTSHG